MAKRLFDVIGSLFGLVCCIPVFLAIALLIKLTSRGPIFYRPIRVGKDGRLIQIYKFRSMVQNADKVGPSITVSDDQRITKIGRFLRRSKLDELPQLFNVLLGDMSIVGPRPEDPRYVALYTPEQRRILEVRPGITSSASVAYRHEETMISSQNWETYYIEKVLPAKLELELDYISNSGLRRDLEILWQTLRVL